MRIPNSLSLVCAATLALGGLTAWADPDTEAQAKAREALRKALQHPSDTAYGGTVALPPHADSETIAKAREALRRKLLEPPAPAPKPVKPVVKAEPKPAKPAKVAPAPSAEPTPQKELAKPAKPAKPAPAPKAEKKIAKHKPAEVTKPVAKAEPKPHKPAKRPKKTDKAVSPVPIVRASEIPVSPLSASKEARLADLLQRYKADKITPQEYHTERAKILAEP